MKKVLLASVLLILGFGCTAKPMSNTETENTVTETKADTVSTENVPAKTEDKPVETSEKKLAVARQFTMEEIEADGGLKEWFRSLARANVAGTKTLVRIPVTHIYGFGCETPTQYCASTIPGGCYGPFLDLKGNLGAVGTSARTCSTTCDDIENRGCTNDFKNTQCTTMWEVEGYVTAASKVKTDPDGGSCTEDGELIYDFEVTRVIQKFSSDLGDDYQFTQYK